MPAACYQGAARRHATLAILCWAFTCNAGAACFAEDVTIVFQQGRRRTRDAQDVHISVDPRLSQHNLGAMHYLGIWQFDGVALIRFDLSPILPTAKVRKASLELYCVSVGFAEEEIQRPWPVSVFECRHSWKEGTGHDQIVRQDGATVNTSDGQTPWPGGAATACAGDLLGTTIHQGSAVRWYTWDLKPNVIQEWISGTRPNYGFMVWGKRPGKAVAFASSDTTTLQNRPKLRLTVSIPAADAAQLVVRFPTDITWEQYRADCGADAQRANQARTEQLFRDKYKGKVVEWTGVIQSVSESLFGRGYRIAIQMAPSDAPISGLDLFLDAGTKFRDQVFGLNEGQKVKFVGRIESQGGFVLTHTIDLLSIEKL